MILRIDTAAIVGDLENRKTGSGPATDRNFAGNPRLEIFERIVDQVRENLFDRQAVAGDIG